MRSNFSNVVTKEEISESEKSDSDKNTKRENTISPEYYQKDVGILLGLKEPAHIEDDDFEEASYKTLWISVINNELQPIMVLDNSLLLPRINGFSNISLSSTLDNGKFENKLKVTSKKKDPNDKTEIKDKRSIIIKAKRMLFKSIILMEESIILKINTLI